MSQRIETWFYIDISSIYSLLLLNCCSLLLLLELFFFFLSFLSCCLLLLLLLFTLFLLYFPFLLFLLFCNLLHIFGYLCLPLSFIFKAILLALFQWMALPVFVHNVALALFALLCLNSTLFYMVHPPFNSKYLIAILTSFRFHFTSLFVCAKHSREGGIITILAFDFHMSFIFVFLFI